jgi:hypothetical protein
MKTQLFYLGAVVSEPVKLTLPNLSFPFLFANQIFVKNINYGNFLQQAHQPLHQRSASHQ